MSFSASIPQATVDTIVGHLVPLFIIAAANDGTLARESASHMLAAFNPVNEPELNLAAEIISLRLHGLQALGQAANPELPLNKTTQLRGSAVSLARQAHKSHRELDQLQHDRRRGAETPSEAATQSPQAHQTAEIVEAVREAAKFVGNKDRKSWSQNLQKRLNAKRIADNLKKNQALHEQRAARPEAAADGGGDPRLL